MLKINRLKGQDSVSNQATYIHCGKGLLRLAAVRPGKIQHLLNQPPHLPGHGEDAL